MALVLQQMEPMHQSFSMPPPGPPVPYFSSQPQPPQPPAFTQPPGRQQQHPHRQQPQPQPPAFAQPLARQQQHQRRQQQPPQQQQQQQQPRNLHARQKTRFKRKGRGRGRQDSAGAPSLAALAANNRQHMRNFGNETPGWTPVRTVPHAPHNDNTFLLAQHGRSGGAQLDSPASTPVRPEGAQWTPGPVYPTDYSSLDKDAADLGAQLDFFGTNEGLISRGYGSSDDDSSDAEGNASEDADSPHGWHLRLEDADSQLPPHVRARLAKQDSYISQLEADNLDLQEKYSLLQHELEELRAHMKTAVGAAAAPAADVPADDVAKNVQAAEGDNAPVNQASPA